MASAKTIQFEGFLNLSGIFAVNSLLAVPHPQSHEYEYWLGKISGPESHRSVQWIIGGIGDRQSRTGALIKVFLAIK